MRFLGTVMLSSLLALPVVFAQTDVPAKDTEETKDTEEIKSLQPSEKDLNEILEAFHDSDKIMKQNAARREFVEIQGAEYPGLDMHLAPLGKQVLKPRMENVLRLQAQDQYMLYRSYDYTRSLTGRPQKSGKIFELSITSLGTSSHDEAEEEPEPEE